MYDCRRAKASASISNLGEEAIVADANARSVEEDTQFLTNFQLDAVRAKRP
jgi:hypothetical protein